MTLAWTHLCQLGNLHVDVRYFLTLFKMITPNGLNINIISH